MNHLPFSSDYKVQWFNYFQGGEGYHSKCTKSWNVETKYMLEYKCAQGVTAPDQISIGIIKRR